jgi:hypothetical protein
VSPEPAATTGTKLVHYSKTHSYLRDKKMKLVDSKSEAGLWPNWNRDGTENWAQIRTCIEFLYLASDPERSKALDKVDQLQNCFGRGGPFYHLLTAHSICADWCFRFALWSIFKYCTVVFSMNMIVT